MKPCSVNETATMKKAGTVRNASTAPSPTTAMAASKSDRSPATAASSPPAANPTGMPADIEARTMPAASPPWTGPPA